jgi:pimeloyl-ACP methyl ester carboxylesterase
LKNMTWQSIALVASLAWALDASGLSYSPCSDAATLPGLRGSLCAKVNVPLSHDTDTSKGNEQITLFVRKFSSPKRARGAVWLIAGGPGESGASLYPFIETLRRSFPGFDLIIPDHRGTGYSSRLCAQEESPDSVGGTALESAEWGTCFGRLINEPSKARQYSITHAAHDLRFLIQQSDNKRPTYLYGVSYGTQLVLRTLQLGKLPVSGVILDSLVPMQSAAQWDLSHRSHVVDAIGRKVLADCDLSESCRQYVGESTELVYRRLISMVAEQPQILAKIPGKNLKLFLGSLLDVPSLRSRIPYVIKDLEQQKTDRLNVIVAELEAIAKPFGSYPQSPVSIPLTSIISGSENNLRPELTLAEITQEESEMLFTSSLPPLLVKPALPLYARDRYFAKLPLHLPPTLVIHGTLDPKTPYEGATDHVTELRKHGNVKVISITDAPHFILWTASKCFETHARAFIRGRTIADGTCEFLGDQARR